MSSAISPSTAVRASGLRIRRGAVEPASQPLLVAQHQLGQPLQQGVEGGAGVPGRAGAVPSGRAGAGDWTYVPQDLTSQIDWRTICPHGRIVDTGRPRTGHLPGYARHCCFSVSLWLITRPPGEPGPPGEPARHGAHGRPRTAAEKWAVQGVARSSRRRFVLIISAAAAGLFAGSYTYAMANPTPRSIPIAVVGIHPATPRRPTRSSSGWRRR